MTRILKLFNRSSFWHNAALLASSTVLGQGLVVAVQPILTRIYKPEDFGLLALYASILSLLAVIINLRYEQAIQLPKEDAEARYLLLLSLVVGLGLSLVFGMAFWLLHDILSNWFNTPLPSYFIFLVPVGLVCIATMQAGSMWALRHAQFDVLAQTKLQQGVWQAMSQVGLGLLLKGPIGLMIGDVLGRLGGIQALLRIMPRNLTNITFQSMWRIAHRYRGFLLYGSWAALLTAASFHLPFVILTAFFGTAAMGQFSLSYRITTIPVTLVAQSIGQVFFSKAAATRTLTELGRLTEQTASMLLALGLPIFGSLFVVAPEAFPLIFGTEWKEAGIYAQLLAPYLLLSIVAHPLSHVLTVREWQKTLLAFTVLELALRIGAIYMGVHSREMYWAVYLFVVSSTVVALLSLVLFFNAAGASWRGFWERASRWIWLNVPIILLLWGMSHWIKGWGLVGLSGIFAVLLLLGSLLHLRREGI